MTMTISGSGTITGLAVGGLPDGTINADDLASNAVTTVKITDANVTTAKIANANVTQAKLETLCVPLGVGQTWQVVTASRASNTNYTNTTGKPIFVYIVETTSANGSFYIDNVVYGSGISATASSRGSIIFIVPAGSTYKWDAGINTWSELR